MVCLTYSHIIPSQPTAEKKSNMNKSAVLTICAAICCYQGWQGVPMVSNCTKVLVYGVAMAQLRFFQKMDTVFQIKLPLFWKYSRVWKGPKAKGCVLALKNWVICSWVIHMALIWSQAMSQIKAIWITQEQMIQLLSAETCPSAFNPFHTFEYLQNLGILSGTQYPFSDKNIS